MLANRLFHSWLGMGLALNLYLSTDFAIAQALVKSIGPSWAWCIVLPLACLGLLQLERLRKALWQARRELLEALRQSLQMWLSVRAHPKAQAVRIRR